jgi:hypothetical protein
MSQFTMQPLPGFGLRDGGFRCVLGGSKKVLTPILKIYIFQTYYER